MLLPNFTQLQINQHRKQLKATRKPTQKQEIKIKQFIIKAPIKQAKNTKNEQYQKIDVGQTVYLHVTKCIMPLKKYKKTQYTIQTNKFKHSREKQQKQSQNSQRAYNFKITNKYQSRNPKQNVKFQQQNNFFQTNSASTVQPPSINEKNKINSVGAGRTKHNSTQMSIKQKKKHPQKQLQQDQVIIKNQKLSLGLKKNKQKGKIKQFMQNMLARTKIDQDITIKRSPFQNQPNHKVLSLSKQKKQPLTNQQQSSISHKITRTEKKMIANRKLNNLNRIPRSNINKGSQTKLPNLNYQNIVEIVKQDQKRRKKKFFQNDSEQENLPLILLPKKLPQIQKLKNNSIIIQQQIQYSSLGRQKQQKDMQIIRQSIHIQN